MKKITLEAAGLYSFICPGCKKEHKIWTAEFQGESPKWKFNGNEEKPTFTPSLRVRDAGVCHSMIKDGTIFFYADSTHDLKGKTVDLLPIS